MRRSRVCSAPLRAAPRPGNITPRGRAAVIVFYPLVGLHDITMRATSFSPGCWQCSQESAPSSEDRPAGRWAPGRGFDWRGALPPGRAASLTFPRPERGCRSKVKSPNHLSCCCRSTPRGARPASSGGGVIRSALNFYRLRRRLPQSEYSAIARMNAQAIAWPYRDMVEMPYA